MFERNAAYLRSRTSNTILLKFWVPLLWIASLIGLFSEGAFDWRLLFALPFVLALTFHLTLAVLRVYDGAIQYRRLMKWTNIHHTEIVSSGVTWPPFVGYIQLKQFVFPWGKLYFVLDPPVANTNWKSDNRRSSYA